jgi:dihydroorotate dehydrogenase electron transfer subunit
MPAPPPDARSVRAEVVSVRSTGDDGVVLRIRPEAAPAPLRAARFFMLRRTDALSPAIPRPFSVYRQYDSGDLEFLIKVMGRGTRALAESRPGTELLAVGPLGLGWPTLDGDGPPWAMVGGGIGSVPFYMGIEQALAGMDGATPVARDAVTFVYGGRHAGFLYDLEEFVELGVRVLAATDDGSAGFHGNVVQCLEDRWASGELPEKVRLLACGPEPMMAAVARTAEERGLDCWLSFETLMGCGVGICNGCAVMTSADGALADWPVAKCCVDGPVFHAHDVTFDDAPRPYA